MDLIFAPLHSSPEESPNVFNKPFSKEELKKMAEKWGPSLQRFQEFLKHSSPTAEDYVGWTFLNSYDSPDMITLISRILATNKSLLEE